jgi:hypothetical protein
MRSQEVVNRRKIMSVGVSRAGKLFAEMNLLDDARSASIAEEFSWMRGKSIETVERRVNCPRSTFLQRL